MKRVAYVCICKALVVLLAVSFCLGVSVISVRAEVKSDAAGIVNQEYSLQGRLKDLLPNQLMVFKIFWCHF